MKNCLQQAQLNVEYWSHEFLELGLNIDSLVNIRAQDFQKIKKKAQSEEEKKYLDNLLEIVISMADEHSPENTPDRFEMNIKEWHIDDDITIQEIEERLEYIMSIKNAVLSDATKRNFWLTNYMSQPALLHFFTIITSKLPSNTVETIPKIVHYMKKIIILSELSELISINQDFTEICKWLYQNNVPPEILIILENISNLNDFLDLLKKVLNFRISLPASWFLSQELVANITSEGILKVEQKISHNSCDDIFLRILFDQYQCVYNHGNVQLNPLTLKDMDIIVKNFSEKLAVYNAKTVIKEKWVYLLILATSDISLTRHVWSMIRASETKLPDPLTRNTEQYLGGYININEFKQKLNRKRRESLANPIQLMKNLLSNSCTEMEINPHAHAVFHKLCLCKCYPKKLKLQEALSVAHEPLKLSLKLPPRLDIKKLSSVILHKIMSYDCEYRDIIGESDDKSITHNDSQGDVTENDMRTSGLHPVDCLLAILICSDDFLRQDIFSRLAKCQFAIPFIMPDQIADQLIFPLWSMRSIIKEFSSIENMQAMQTTKPIIKHPMKIVSFVRLGNQQKYGRSKSKILNNIISNGNHDHFFHYDLPGAQYECVLGKGLVDMCWYLPSGKATDKFKEPITFLNLHGDAREHPVQFKILSEISFVFFAVLTEDIFQLSDSIKVIINQMYSSPGGIVFLNAIQTDQLLLKKEYPRATYISLQSMNAANTNTIVCSKLRAKIETSYIAKSIEDLCDIISQYVIVDEFANECKAGKKYANDLLKIVKDNAGCRRDDLLPLQGKNWKEWASADKEYHRCTQRGNLTVNTYVEKIKKKKAIIRQQQLAHSKNLTPLIKFFVKYLEECRGPQNFMIRNYFLQYLKLELNNLSIQDISGKQYKYKQLRDTLSNSDSSSTFSNAQPELLELQNEIIESSLGLEHFLREIGQVYESVQGSEMHKRYCNLPKIAAELLIDGYPIELIDGDASHCPLNWVTAVLNEAIILLKNPNVFVFSVLGIQSSGKSTMLNTIFGLQFNVSAGRCTRGAFMQLLPLDDELKEKTKCKYVLIIDTEGLRAPELDPNEMQKHDNELATFVIGLANLTFVSIYGEVTGDMDNILQTAVHAFLRMSEVKIFPSCKFIHQNTGADIKCEVGRANLTKKLDDFTAIAAKEEKNVKIFKFKDVIAFDDHKDVHYFTGLWKGDPPMAPINQGYSRQAQELKHQVIEILLQERTIKRQFLFRDKSQNKISLTTFCGRVKDLWKGLLKENFVFSFKNTMEITAYNSLEVAYNKWEWSFNEDMIKWESKTENELSTELLDDISEKTKLKLQHLHNYISEQYDSIKAEMNNYFEQHGDRVIQWKSKFERKLDNLKKELKQHAEQHCKAIEQNSRTVSNFKNQQIQHTNFITDQIQHHLDEKRKEQTSLEESLQKRTLTADQLKYLCECNLFCSEQLTQYCDQNIITYEQMIAIENFLATHGGTEKAIELILIGEMLQMKQITKILKKIPQSEENLRQNFEKIWCKLLQEIIPLNNTSEVDTVTSDTEQALINYVGSIRENQLMLELRRKSLNEWYSSGTDPAPSTSIIKSFFSSALYSFEKLWHKICTTEAADQPTTQEQEDLKVKLKEEVISKVEEELRNLLKKKTDFSSSYTNNVLQCVDDVIKEKPGVSMFPNLKYELYCIACSYALPKFKDMKRRFQERSDPRMYFENRVKGPQFVKFKNQYKETEAEDGISDTICAYLQEPIKTQVSKLLGVQLVSQMKDSDHSFSSKTALKIKVLMDLHKENSFENYIQYLRNVKTYLENRLKTYTINFCDESSGGDNITRLQRAAKKEASRLIHVICTIVHSLNVTDIKKFIIQFNNAVRKEIGEIIKPEVILAGYGSLEKINIENLKGKIKTELENLEVKLHKSFSTISCEKEMGFWKNKPHELLENLIGCTAQCPFCGEQCDLLDPNHENDCDHRIEIHRISCLKGKRWKDSGVMTTHFCQASVSHADLLFEHKEDEYHPYNDYKSIYKNWEIAPDISSEGSLYWQWFVGKYYENIAKEFGAKPPDVPDEWRHIEWSTVEKNLKELAIQY